MTRIDEGELLLPLHGGLHETPPWGTFLARLRRRTDADYVALIFRQGDAPIHEATQLFAGRDLRAEARRLGNLYALDPIPYDSLRVGRVYSAEEMIDPHDARHDRFRADYLERIGVRHGRFMRVAAGGVGAWAILSRAQDDFTAADASLLAALAPHLSVALGTFAMLERERLRAATADAALTRAGIGWAALDGEGRAIAASPLGERLLSPATAAGRLIGERLVPRAPGAARALAEAGAAFAADPDAPPRAIRLADDPPLDTVAQAVRDRPLAASTMPALVLLVREPRAAAGRPELLAALLGLTAGEARLALALADGRSIAEAARALRLTVETARNYSKRLYAKTGTRGQADLVRLVLTSAATLG